MNIYFNLGVGMIVGYIISLIINPYKNKLKLVKRENVFLHDKYKNTNLAFQKKCSDYRVLNKKADAFIYNLYLNIYPLMVFYCKELEKEKALTKKLTDSYNCFLLLVVKKRERMSTLEDIDLYTSFYENNIKKESILFFKDYDAQMILECFVDELIKKQVEDYSLCTQ